MKILISNKEVLIDKVDWEKLKHLRWHLDSNGYVRHTFSRNKVWGCRLMHRVIAGAPKGLEVDHINMNRQDNRRKNLRLVTRNQNQWNRTKYLSNTSGFKGVHWAPADKLWVARVQFMGKRYHAGSSKIKEVAAKAYNKLARRLHEEYVRPNRGV